MIVHSKQFIKNPESLDEKCIQPNAIDIRIQRLWKVIPGNVAVFSEESRPFRPRDEVPLYLRSELKDVWELLPGVYDFETDHFVEVPEGIAGWIVGRSTLIRNGLIVASGIYDSGFKNKIGGMIHVTSGPVMLQRNTRIAQFITFSAETNHLYNGVYNSGH